MRLMPNAAASDRVKMIALLPMPVPTTARASGCASARKMMNGIGRKMFTSTFSTANTGPFSRMLPRLVVYSPSLIARPPIPPNSSESPTMKSVS